MAWLGLDKLLLGVDLDQQQQQEDQYTADTAAWQAQKVASGQWTAAQGQQAAQDLNNQIAENTNIVGQVDQAFVQGAEDGLNNVLTAPGKVVGFTGDSLGTLLGGILKNIPWWLWVGAAVALFFWMGGATLLKGRLKNYA